MSTKVVSSFWNAMASNDFADAAKWLHPQFEYYMPQTREYLTGREDFVALNNGYPANGKWLFDVRTIVAQGNQVVSDVEITDGSMKARAITFHFLDGKMILRQKEYWPEDYPAPGWRSHLFQVVSKPPF